MNLHTESLGEADFTDRKLDEIRRRFSAETELDDRKAMEIIAEEVFGDEDCEPFDDETVDRIIKKLFYKTRRSLCNWNNKSKRNYNSLGEKHRKTSIQCYSMAM